MTTPRPRSRPRFALACLAAIGLATASHAFADAPPDAQARAVGLPNGGGLDPQRVVAARYGEKDVQPHEGEKSSPHESEKIVQQHEGAKDVQERDGEKKAPPHRKAAVAAPPGGITTVTLDSTRAQARQHDVPLTFGQVFVPGDLAKGQALAGRFADGTSIPLQLDVKATHADGSVRHALVSAVVPEVRAGELRGMALAKAGTAKGAGKGHATPADLLRAGFHATVTANIGGTEYSASADKLLAQQKPTAWIDGPVATEWLVDAPLATAKGDAHPHLAARFAIRWYHALKRARVDVTVENDWAFQPSPQNFTYDATITVGGKQVYAKAGLTHLHHARWRKVFWWGEAPQLDVRHDTGYLIASMALPNYDQSIAVSEAALAALQSKWTGPRTEPMGVGMGIPYMPATGGRDDIGLLPAWGALYLLSMDPRAKEVTLGTADLAGSWSAHYRDQHTGRPVSLLDYPYMTTLGTPADTLNPATHKQEAFPPCASASVCKSPNSHDSAHQPAFAYLPYLVTGDYYYLEELQFWAMWNVFSSNPEYREREKGLLKSGQVRGQAWSLRTLAEAAYITPDGDPLKPQFARILASNLDWYNSAYTNNPDANALGVIVDGYALVYKNKTGLAPWQDDFFTAAVGHTAELGFRKAAPLLAYKARFPVARMVGKDACWVRASMYDMVVRDTPTAPLYGSIGQAYKASTGEELAHLPCGGPEMAAALKLKVGEMTGYASTPTGFPSNMQPALAYAAGVSGKAGRQAWERFMARSVKPDYSGAPQFAIVPRR